MAEMYFKLIICFLSVVSLTSSSEFDWEQFKHDHNKRYASAAEEIERKQIFLENVGKMKEYQRMYPEATFTMGINHLADRRAEELVTATKIPLDTRPRIRGIPVEIKSDVPTSLDWRLKGVITDVYDQGTQAKVSATAAVEVIESYHAIRTTQLVKGSVDQVSKCCSEDVNIFDCILNKLDGGICAANAYNSSGAACDRSTCEPFAKFNKVNRFEPADENTMVVLIQESPLFVGIDASQVSFQLYQTGIYSDPGCSKTTIDHVVQLVGYGVESNVPYWILKNSWGRNWGDRGYIRIERGTNMCGIANVVEQIQSTTGDGTRRVPFTGLYLALLCVACYLSSK